LQKGKKKYCHIFLFQQRKHGRVKGRVFVTCGNILVLQVKTVCNPSNICFFFPMDAIRLQFHFVRGGRINDCKKRVLFNYFKKHCGKKKFKKRKVQLNVLSRLNFKKKNQTTNISEEEFLNMK
jgi:hypothetical protein